MLRQITLIILFITFSGTCNASQANTHWNQELFNAVYFDSNIGVYGETVVNLGKVRMALIKGADPNWISPDNSSILGRFVRLIAADVIKPKDGNQAIKILFDHGAKIQKNDSAIFFRPVLNGHYYIVKLLLEHGVSAKSWAIDVGTKLTPVEVATKRGYDKIVLLLEQYGAKEVNKKEAVQLRFIEAASYDGSQQEFASLLKQGARVNAINKDGETALNNAVLAFFTTNGEMNLRYLLGQGANPNIESKGFYCFRCPSLHVATIIASQYLKYTRGVKEGIILLESLLNYGAYVSGRNAVGMTPLHFAAKYNNIYAAKLFLEKGALVMPKDNQGKTPLDYAESTEMIKLLKEHGAKER